MLHAATALAVLEGLSESRPVFHSERDFQLALGFAFHLAHPTMRVRLETSPLTGVNLDMLIADPSDETSLAIELKYPTNGWVGTVDGEAFELSAGADDQARYDFLKDVSRLERVVATGHATSGLAILLTNQSLTWDGAPHHRPTNADAFLLTEGLVVTGSRAWGPKTGAGTMGKERRDPVDLSGTYALAWRDYSVLPGPRGRFRYLAVVVDP